MKSLRISGGWLTVNRFCNFKCGWCYAKGTRYRPRDDMSWKLARNLVDLMAAIGIQNVILIGGETLFWPHLFDLAEYIAHLEMESTVVTNGWLLGSESFRARLATSKIRQVNISLKGASREQYITLTGVDCFERVCDGIYQTSQITDMSINASVVLSKALLGKMPEVATVAAESGAGHLLITHCGPSIYPSEGYDDTYMPEPTEFVADLVSSYREVNSTMRGSFTIEMGVPRCLWPEEDLRFLEGGHHLSYSCHFKKRGGLIFDGQGRVLPCNHLHGYPLGSFEKDFTDLGSFIEFWNKPEWEDFYAKMISYPSTKCVRCDSFVDCGGGCPLLWLVRNPREVIEKGGI